MDTLRRFTFVPPLSRVIHIVKGDSLVVIMHFPTELKDKWGDHMREDIIDQIEIINLYFNKIRTIQEQEVEKG